MLINNPDLKVGVKQMQIIKGLYQYRNVYYLLLTLKFNEVVQQALHAAATDGKA